MGLFSSEHVFTAYAASSSLLEEDSRTSTVRGLLLQTSIDDVGSMAEAVKIGLQIDLYGRAKSMLRYGRRDPDGYVYGLPEPTHPYKEYLPIVPLLQDRVWFDDADDPIYEKSTDRMLKRLALDPYEIKEQYIESVEEGIASGDRPGSDELDDWDFFIHFAVPMHTRTEGSRDYIYNYLQYLKTISWSDRDEYVAFLDGGQVGDQPSSNFHLSEGEGSDPDWTKPADAYEVFYKWSYVESITKDGEYTPPGWSEPLRAGRHYSKIYQFTDSDYAEGIEEVHGEGATVALQQGPEGTYHTYAVFTEQHQDGTYTQVLIMAPSMMYVINVTDEDNVTEWQYVDVRLFPEDPEEESEFKWPVMVESLKQVRAMHREECLQEALCATVFLVSHQTVKWYQQTFFKWLIVIIIIIILVIAQQYHLLYMVKEMAVAAFAVGATGTALAFSALYVTMVFAIGFMISFAGALIGGKWGQLFVIVASLYMAGMNPFANIGQSWGNMVANFGFGTAQSFLSAVMPMLQIIEVGYSAYQTDKLEGEYEDFMKTKKEKYQELRDAYDMLGDVPAGIDPLFITNTFVGHHNESPESFYERTLNANPGVLGYDLVNDFSKIALTLPEAENDSSIVDTIMDSFERQRGAA